MTVRSAAHSGKRLSFLAHFEDPPDLRQRTEVVYPLDEILSLCLLAVVAGVESITDKARFGGKKRAFRRRFGPFVDGTPESLFDLNRRIDAWSNVVLSRPPLSFGGAGAKRRPRRRPPGRTERSEEFRQSPLARALQAEGSGRTTRSIAARRRNPGRTGSETTSSSQSSSRRENLARSPGRIAP